MHPGTPFPVLSLTLIHQGHAAAVLVRLPLQPPLPLVPSDTVLGVQFWLDCSTMPEVIKVVQESDKSLVDRLFKLTRNYCHTIHTKRVLLLEQTE